MRIEGYKDIVLSIEELVELSEGNLSAKNIKFYCHRAAAKQNSTVWLSQPDPTDGRKILISYKSIPKTTIEKYGLPSIDTLKELVRQERALEQEGQKQLTLEFAQGRLQDCINHALNEDFVKYCKVYDKLFPKYKDRSKVLLFAKTHSVLQCCIDLKPRYTIAELHSAYLRAPGIKITLKNQLKFGQRLKEWQTSPIQLIHKAKGKPKTEIRKMSDWHIAVIRDLYAHPNKLTNRIIHNMLTDECLQQGKTVVSLGSVEKYLARPEVKNALSISRDKDYYRRVVQPYTRRKAPLYAGDLYYADGSPIQMTCLNEAQNKEIRLNLFVVMDVNSKKIVGFDLAESEDKFNWMAAFKMAFGVQMLLPFEVMYDNASATKTAEFKALKEALMLKGCTLNPTTKGEPKQKADVERWFNTFQSEYQRCVDGYIGEGIRSKRQNGHTDVEHLAYLRKTKGVPTKSETIEIISQLIAAYNANGREKKVSPNQKFAESERPNVVPIDAADLALLFNHSRKIKVSNSEVKLTIRHNEYYYEVYEHTAALKIDGTSVMVYYDETDLSGVHICDLDGGYLCYCRQKVQFHKAKANQTEADVHQIIKQTKHNEAKKNVAKGINNELVAPLAGLELQTLNPLNAALKDSRNDAETQAYLNWVQQATGIKFTDKIGNVDFNDRPNPNKKTKTIQEKHAKKNIVAATLTVIERP
ncbi:DDE-type integrase/transposase/recombinase [Mucilaginibacter rigui]|uniref:DDE-type integrase/transposase/recombinase n=1 Tax=Mucilaginibacter rigui TaxID=534635 RepID=A0ABR7X813_9SPHI|nr:Mu transposase C-terminal domain-containing protein [Mucilaginibacter rigui]MBD1385725.1 DDE-type integrase/transposase/recombinase [Mucilaginibacter rigui]